MTTTLRARPTTYKGIAMRSRLEARVAGELDAGGDAWVYEPRAYANEGGQYLPDFEITDRALPMFIEVRPTYESGLPARERMAIIWDSEPSAVLVVMTADGWYLVAMGHDRVWTEHRHAALGFAG